jgi:hypothetical protein
MVGRCGGDCAEDLRHFMVECPAYDHIRNQFPDVFTYQHGQTVEAWQQIVCNGDQQGQLAQCVLQIIDSVAKCFVGQGDYVWRDAQAATVWLHPFDVLLGQTGALFAYGRAGMPGFRV